MAEKSKASVKSPVDSREGTIANCGGMPPTLDPKEIWKENQPPATPAKDSVTSKGSK